MDLISEPVDQTSSPQAKIALFRSLFRGRDDVYPRRFESAKRAGPGTRPHVPSISIRPAGAKMRQRFLKRVTASISQSHSNDHAPGGARMSGSFSKKPFQPRLPDDWDRMSSPRPWRGVQISVSIRMTGCFRIKTRCPKEDLET